MNELSASPRTVSASERRFKAFWIKVVLVLPILLFIALCLLPFVTMLAASFSDNELLGELGVALWPRGFSLAAYQYVFMFPQRVFHAYFISIVVTAAGTVLSLIMCLLAAYAISRPNFRYARVISFLFFFTVLFNGGLIATYIVIKRYLQLYDTIFVLILPQLAVPTHIFLLKIFYQGLPNSLFESAKLDGAGEFSIFARVATPLIVPGIVTVLFYIMLIYWNDSQTPLIYIERQNLEPLQLMLQRINDYIKFIQLNSQMTGGMTSGMEVPEDTMVYATSVIATGPMMLLFAYFQKYFVRGMTAGSVKG